LNLNQIILKAYILSTVVLGIGFDVTTQDEACSNGEADSGEKEEPSHRAGEAS
jgi:hypothetical protein